MSTAEEPRISLKVFLPLAAVVLAVCALLMFYDLGRYALWIDEADTALYAKGIARTGDTSAILDQNVFAVREGSSLINYRGRYEPPLSFYLAAPFVGRDGNGAFWPRFPFALCGLASVALMLYWLWRDQAPLLLVVLVSLAIIANVSLMLYFRQCRYYALATLLSLGAAYFYLHWNGRRSMLVGFSICTALLLFTHYLPYAGLMVAVGLDYLLFQREPRLTRREIAFLILSQVALVAIAVWIWNPFLPGVNFEEKRHAILDKLTLLWWNFRDLNVCQFGAGVLLLASPLLYLLDRNAWFIRGPVAIVTYILAITLLSPQALSLTHAADVRYLAALIPLCLFLSALAVWTLSRGWWLAALPLAAIVFFTNVANHPWDFSKWRSTFYDFTQELRISRNTPTLLVADWLREHAKPRQTVWAFPLTFMPSLMYHAPEYLYCWQFRSKDLAKFPELDRIHFRGEGSPDFIISFSSDATPKDVIKQYEALGIHYKFLGIINILYDSATRPEFMYRYFYPPDRFDRAKEAIYIYQRQTNDAQP